MQLFLLFQDLGTMWEKIADQGIAISVLALILIFVVVLVTKIMPTWERIEISKSDSRAELSKALGALALAQTENTAVIRTIAVDNKNSTEAVKLLQRVNASSSDQLAADVQILTEKTQDLIGGMNTLNERLDRLETNENGK